MQRNHIQPKMRKMPREATEGGFRQRLDNEFSKVR